MQDSFQKESSYSQRDGSASVHTREGASAASLSDDDRNPNSSYVPSSKALFPLDAPIAPQAPDQDPMGLDLSMDPGPPPQDVPSFTGPSVPEPIEDIAPQESVCTRRCCVDRARTFLTKHLPKTAADGRKLTVDQQSALVSRLYADYVWLYRARRAAPDHPAVHLPPAPRPPSRTSRRVKRIALSSAVNPPPRLLAAAAQVVASSPPAHSQAEDRPSRPRRIRHSHKRPTDLPAVPTPLRHRSVGDPHDSEWRHLMQSVGFGCMGGAVQNSAQRPGIAGGTSSKLGPIGVDAIPSYENRGGAVSPRRTRRTRRRLGGPAGRCAEPNGNVASYIRRLEEAASLQLEDAASPPTRLSPRRSLVYAPFVVDLPVPLAVKDVLQREHITDAVAFLSLSPADIAGLDLPLGHRKRLEAAQRVVSAAGVGGTRDHGADAMLGGSLKPPSRGSRRCDVDAQPDDCRTPPELAQLDDALEALSLASWRAFRTSPSLDVGPVLSRRFSTQPSVFAGDTDMSSYVVPVDEGYEERARGTFVWGDRPDADGEGISITEPRDGGTRGIGWGGEASRGDDGTAVSGGSVRGITGPASPVGVSLSITGPEESASPRSHGRAAGRPSSRPPSPPQSSSGGLATSPPKRTNSAIAALRNALSNAKKAAAAPPELPTPPPAPLASPQQPPARPPVETPPPQRPPAPPLAPLPRIGISALDSVAPPHLASRAPTASVAAVAAASVSAPLLPQNSIAALADDVAPAVHAPVDLSTCDQRSAAPKVGMDLDSGVAPSSKPAPVSENANALHGAAVLGDRAPEPSRGPSASEAKPSVSPPRAPSESSSSHPVPEVEERRKASSEVDGDQGSADGSAAVVEEGVGSESSKALAEVEGEVVHASPIVASNRSEKKTDAGGAGSEGSEDEGFMEEIV